MTENTAAEAPESSAGNEGEFAGVGDTRTQSIPYSRFSEVNTARKEAEAKAQALEQKLNQYTQTQQQQAATGGKFKQSYASIDEFYSDIAKNASSDPAFLDAILKGLFETNGDKFDETLFNSLTRFNQKVTKQSDELLNKAAQEQTEKMNRIETDFGEDKAGFDAFYDWLGNIVGTEDAPKEDAPSWARDFDTAYEVYKQYEYQKPTMPMTAKRISKARTGGKVTPEVDLSGDFHDVTRRMFGN